MKINFYSLLGFIIFFSCAFSIKVNAQDRLSLRQALQMAKANNPVLQAEKIDIEIAKAELISAKIRPNLVFSNETIFMTNSADFEPQTKWSDGRNREELWQLSKPFQIAGQRKKKIEVATKSILFEEISFEEAERNLFAEVADKWLEVWAASKKLEIVESAKINVDSLLFINQHRYRNQAITKTDLSRTELISKQYQLELNKAVQEVISGQTELKLLLGTKENIEIDMEDEFLFSLPADLETMLNEALENRSDIRAARAFSEVSESNIKLQRSLAYPQPEIGVIYNPQNSVPHFGIAASIELPFFDRNQGEVKIAQLEREKAERETENLAIQIENEIAVVFSNYQLQKQNIEGYQDLLDQSEQILSSVRYAYVRGGTTILDYLEAQSNWLEIRQDYYEEMSEFKQTLIQLLYTTGLINQLAL